MKKEKGISLIILIIIIILVVFALVIILGRNSNNDNFSTNTGSKSSSSYGLGDTITFSGLELTFDSSYSFDTVASTIVTDYNGTYIKLGVTIKNISTEKNSLNVLYYDFYGSKGTQLSEIAGYFDDSVESVGTLKPEASCKSYFYIFYDGDGIYSIDFNNYSQDISVEFNVTK